MSDKPVDIIVYMKARISNFCTKQDFFDSEKKDFKSFAEEIICEEGVSGLIDNEDIKFQDIIIDVKPELTNKEITEISAIPYVVDLEIGVK